MAVADKTHPMRDLVAASLRAILQAEAQSAQETIEYIRSVGFEGDESARKGGLGKLRMVEFSHMRTGADGNPVEIRTQAPLLSLVPIPSVSVKKATLDFGVDVTRMDGKEGSKSQLYGTIAPSRGSAVPPGDIRINMEVGPGDVPNGVGRLLAAMDNAFLERTKITEEPRPPTRVAKPSAPQRTTLTRAESVKTTDRKTQKARRPK